MGFSYVLLSLSPHATTITSIIARHHIILLLYIALTIQPPLPAYLSTIT